MRLCFVLLPDAKPLTSAALDKALKAFPELGKATGFKERDGVPHFKVGKLEVMAALMPAPVPDGEAEEATDRSLSGLGGSWALPEHRAHLAVVSPGEKKKVDLEELIAFTRVVAAIARATGAIGVYWGEGRATHHPEFMENIAHSELPLPIWAGISVAPKGEGFELLSVGMHQLELPDLLMTSPSLGGDVLEFFYDLLAYITRRGKQLPEGDTVGRDEKERLKVKYVPSPLDKKVKVWSVTLPAPKKAKAAPKKKPVKGKKKK